MDLCNLPVKMFWDLYFFDNATEFLLFCPGLSAASERTCRFSEVSVIQVLQFATDIVKCPEYFMDCDCFV